MSKTVGVVGLGIMGGAMSANLLKDGAKVDNGNTRMRSNQINEHGLAAVCDVHA